jgi:DNA-binding NtrC family response regulator/ABC-type amino acid transport substrate-binding protein
MPCFRGLVAERERTIRIIRAIAVATLFFCLAWPAIVLGQDADFIASLSERERTFLRAHPVIRVGGETDWAPYDFVKSGEHQGIAADYLKLLRETLGVEFRVETGRTWEQLLNAARDGEIDMLPALWKHPDREQFLAYTTPYASTSDFIIARTGEIGMHSLEDLTERKVATVKGYVTEQTLADRVPGIELVRSDDLLAALRTVANGEADAHVGDYGVVSYAIEQNGIAGLDLAAPAGIRESLHMAVREDWSILAGIVSRVIIDLDPATHRDIRRRWLGPSKRRTLDLLPDQLAFLEEHPVLRVGADNNWAPIDFVRSGVHTGLAADYLALLTARLGIRYELVPTENWDQVLEKMRTREIDVVSALTPSEERAEYIEFTEPIYRAPQAIFTRDDAPDITGITDLYEKRVAVVNGYFIEEQLAENHPRILLAPVDDVKEGLARVSSGDAFAFVGYLAVGVYQIREEGYTNVIVGADAEILHELHFGVRKDWKPLTELLDAALADLTPVERDEIANRWVPILHKTTLPWKEILFGIGAAFLAVVGVTWRNRSMAREIRKRKQVEAGLARELRVAQELLKEAKRKSEGPLLGTSAPLETLKAEIARLASAEEVAVLVGPPGVGKEAVARAIHDESPRGGQAFIHVNCATMQTGTHALIGVGEIDAPSSLFDLAIGGTIYLDGFALLSPEGQQQLLPVLEQREAGEGPDVRVILGSAQNLDEDLQQSRLESGLHRLLAARQIRVPLVAERQEDIPDIATYFAEQHARHLGRGFEKFSDDAINRLKSYRWPGNIKELRSVAERSVMLSKGPVVDVDENVLEGGPSVGSYRLVRKLGAGGMGEVWLAKHQLLSRPAAVKFIRRDAVAQDASDGTIQMRFQREAEATANLRSPHTVELYDFGVSDTGDFYYVMECLFGRDLESMVRKFGPMSPERTVHFLKQACRSLGEAHQTGLVHRDIKPANLFACLMGTTFDFLKVLDFGMVKGQPGREQAQLTEAGYAVGTPAYMAPEVAMDGDLDGRADLYALGCVGFWLITGARVFEEDNPTKMIFAHVQKPPPVPSELSEETIPERLDAAILHCLAKDPAERPQSADELWEELDAIETDRVWSHDRARKWWELHVPDSSTVDESDFAGEAKTMDRPDREHSG